MIAFLWDFASVFDIFGTLLHGYKYRFSSPRTSFRILALRLSFLFVLLQTLFLPLLDSFAFPMASQSKHILLTKGTWVDKSVAGQFTMVRPFEDERVCHAALENEDDYYFMYETLFLDLGISLPFDFFADVLRELGVAPSQLHPNSWAALRAF
ncbi:hypothetical protein CR513_16317, partial [Mucuna pruriens]